MAVTLGPPPLGEPLNNYPWRNWFDQLWQLQRDVPGLNTAQTNVTWTVNSSGISLNAAGYVGTAFTTTSTTGAVITATHNSAGVTLAVPAFLTTARASSDAIGLNTAQTNVTWTVNSSGISLNAAGYVGTNTAKTNVTWTVNSAGLSLNAAGYAGTGTSATNASVTLDSNGLAINVPSGGTTLSYWENEDWDFGNSGTTTGSLSNLLLTPLLPQNPVSCNLVQMIGSASLPSVSAANTMTVRVANGNTLRFVASISNTCDNLVNLVLMSRGTGNNTDNLFTVGSTQASFRTLQSHVYDVSASGGGSASMSIKSSLSVSVSYPALTSAQSVNGASSWTTWGIGYSTWSSSTTASASLASSSSNTFSTSCATAWPGTTAWASNKLIPLPFATSLSAGQWWLGYWRHSNTSSTQSTAQSNASATNCSYTSNVAGSNLTMTGQITWAGLTGAIANSLGWLGGNSQATLAPIEGHGSFSGTWSPGTTYLNAAGQPNGAIAMSQISSMAGFFQPYVGLQVKRVGSQ